MVLPRPRHIPAMAICLLSADTVACGLAPGWWHVSGLSPAVWCHPPEHVACFPRCRLRGSRVGSQGRGSGAAHDSPACAHHWRCCRVDGKGAGLGKLTGQTLTCPQTSSPTPTNRHQSHCSVDSGEQLKGFPPNWTMTICRRGVGGRRVQLAQLVMPLSSSSTWSPPCPAGWPLHPAQRLRGAVGSPRQMGLWPGLCGLDTFPASVNLMLNIYPAYAGPASFWTPW